MKKQNRFSLKQLFDNKRFVQVFALVVAAFFWLLVAMTQNYPITRVIYNVPVRVNSQPNALSSIGLHAIDDENIRVDVEVEGLRSVVGQLTPDDFLLTVRLTGVTEAATYELIPMSIDIAPNPDYSIIGFLPEKVKIRFDRLSQKTFAVEERIQGLSIAQGYTEKMTVVTPDTITVEGPATELERIAYAGITTELTEPLDKTHSEELQVVFYDANGDELELEEMHLSADRTQAHLTIQVLKVINLPLAVDYINIPRGFPKDELLERTRFSQFDVTIAGPSDLIDRLTEIQLGYIDLKSIRIDRTLFPFDVPLPSPQDQFMRLDNVMSVVVGINDRDLESAVFNVSNPRLLNTPSGFEVELLADTIYNVEFVGKREIIEAMTADDIVAEIDLSEREIVSGSYPMPVKISVPGKGLVWAVGDHSITIQATTS
ncbi:MAG: hypothetical protein FWG94_07090 [Oscillospiraceae bacterium]|nr:hypothetical protein [Oscillospiraceae bacterium]